jgi:hypothetical protein
MMQGFGSESRLICHSGRLLILLTLLLLVGPGDAVGSSSASARIAVHVTPLVMKNQCTPTNFDECADAVPQGTLTDPEGTQFRVYVVGLADSLGNSFNARVLIDYDQSASDGSNNGRGIDIDGGSCCGQCFSGALPQAPPEPLSYLITGACGGPTFQILFYYDVTVYSPDTLRVVAGQEPYSTVVHDCVTTVVTPLEPEQLGYAAFTWGGSPGCNPCLISCGATPVRAATWSGIKTLLR